MVQNLYSLFHSRIENFVNILYLACTILMNIESSTIKQEYELAFKSYSLIHTLINAHLVNILNLVGGDQPPKVLKRTHCQM